MIDSPQPPLPPGREVQILQSFLQEVSGPLAMKEAGRRVAAASRRLFRHDAFVLVIFHDGPARVESMYSEDTPEGAAEPREVAPGKPGPSSAARTIASEGKARLINRTDPPSDTPFERFGTVQRLSRSLMFAPIRWAGSVVGYLSAQSYTPGRYGEDDLRLLQTLGDVCGGVLERLRMEERLRESDAHLRQAQKMEVVGRIAGGIAHDFNNLLTVVIGCGELLRAELQGGPLAVHVHEILRSAQRAAGLTRQLLAYSRRQVLQLKVIDLNAIVGDLQAILRRVLEEHIRIEMKLAPELPRIRADQSQIEQVIMNLSINARDAMPRGGTLLLETAAVEIPEGSAESEAPPGAWVRLSIADTGTGIPPEVRAHLFEPFFTTKGVGQGSGLGLSTVYGIVMQTGGHIDVDTEVGRGTRFRIYLPATTDRPSERRRPAAGEGRLQESGTVLLVEDDDSVRMISAQVLRRMGLEVIEAGDGEEALAVGGRGEQRIDLLVTDVIMPGQNGIETAARLRKLRPGLPVLYVSGYSPLLFSSHPSLEPGAPYLQKPYSSRDLIAAVQDVLGAARR